jgi:hypothetical protein
MDNLIAIENCKNDIKSALINKGVDMTDVAFSGYAEKINALQLESGDAPAPTPSADYVYSNGYLTSGDVTNEIINFVPYEIVLDGEGKCVFDFTCPVEYPIYDGEHFDIIFTVDVPETYTLTKFEFLDESSDSYINQAYKENPRYSSKERNGIIYNSFVRNVADEKDYASMDVATDILYYKITIESI